MKDVKKTIVLTDYNDEVHIIKIDESQERLLNWLMKKDIVDFEIKEFQDTEVEEI